MPELLKNGGVVELWAGWSLQLPSSYYERNEDGSWSAWGNDWAVDAQIIEVGGGPSGEPVQPQNLLGPDKQADISGSGWVGTIEMLKEKDGDREVYRLAARLAAVNTLLSFWVSYFDEQRSEFAKDLVRKVTHDAQHG